MAYDMIMSIKEEEEDFTYIEYEAVIGFIYLILTSLSLFLLVILSKNKIKIIEKGEPGVGFGMVVVEDQNKVINWNEWMKERDYDQFFLNHFSDFSLWFFLI